MYFSADNVCFHVRPMHHEKQADAEAMDASCFWQEGLLASPPWLENLHERFCRLDLPHLVVRKYAVSTRRVVRKLRSPHYVDRRACDSLSARKDKRLSLLLLLLLLLLTVSVAVGVAVVDRVVYAVRVKSDM